jgi:outer membrane receptor protein involved in Fe transport
VKQTNTILKILIYLLVCFCSTNTLSAEKYIPFNSLHSDTLYNTLDSITVTSRNIKTLSINSPYSVTGITGKTIRSGNFRTTPEALTGNSGVFIQKTNHGGGSAFLRGLTGNQILLLVDGIRFNNATFRYGPNQYLNSIDIFTIDKIEVGHGTGSVEYGSDALGGVINLLTKDPKFTTGKSSIQANVAGKFISEGMEKSSRAELKYANKNIALLTGLTYRNFGNLVGGGDIGDQIPSGYKENGIDIKLKMKLNKTLQLTYGSQFLQQNNVPVYHKVVLENFKINEIELQQRKLNYIRLLQKTNKRLFSEIIFTASIQNSLEKRISQKNGSLLLKTEQDEIKSLGLSGEAISSISPNWSINSGIDVYRDRVFSSTSEQNISNQIINTKRGLYPNDAFYLNQSIFSLHHIRLNKFNIETGIRYNVFKINIYDSSLGKVENKPTALVGNFGATYHINQFHHISATISNGYRAPNIDDMGTLGIVDFRYEIPTNNLKPEKSVYTEIGYKIQHAKWNFNLHLFYMKLKDLITRVKLDNTVINGYNVYKKENVETSHIKGIEALTNIALSKYWSFKFNATYTYGQNDTKNEPMRRTPPFFGTSSINWEKHKLQIALSHQFAGQQIRLAQGDKDDNRIGVNGTPSWNILNFSTGAQFKIITINAGIQNILNEKYKTHGSGVYGMGRAFFSTISIHL